MKVRETKDIQGVDRAAVAPAEAHVRHASDKVTVEEVRPPADLVAAARHNATAGRAERLRQLESALKGGHYRPDAQRIADQILSTAEIDARLRAMMQKG
jgi:anti-sigma28 factor (negative regulator of flagellin synthesis)